MAGITGIGSGMDINSVVRAMVDAEVAPKAAQLNRLEKTTTTKLSALGQLKSALSKLQTTAKDLNKLDKFEQRTASSSNSGALSASASADALPGRYSVEVMQLASSSKVATAAVATGFSADAEGSLTFRLGADDDSAVTVNVAAGASLVEVRDSINEQLKDKGISANIVHNPAKGTSQLVFSAGETGNGKDIVVEGEGGVAGFAVDPSVAAQSAAGGYLTQAQNAIFSVDGLLLESSGNTVEGVIPDVSFTLKGKTAENQPLTVTVGQNNSGVKDNLKKFVEAYNEFVGVAQEVTTVAQVGDGKPVVGGLVGDSTVRSMLSGIRGEFGALSGLGDVRVLADLGITTQKDGTLSIDDEKLGRALESSYDAVAQFVAGDNGLMSRLDQRINGYVQTNGVLDQRMKGLRETTKTIDTQRETLMRRSEQIEARLFKQFNAMDALVGQLTQTSDRLAQSLNNLPGFVRKETK